MVDFHEAQTSVELASEQLHNAQVASWEPTEPADCVSYSFYAYENLVVAAAEASGQRWTKNHREKAELALHLYKQGILKTDVSRELPRLNDLRKDVSYGEPGFDMSLEDLEDLVSNLETFHDEVVELVESLEAEADESE